jgi:hypothetical protein
MWNLFMKMIGFFPRIINEGDFLSVKNWQSHLEPAHLEPYFLSLLTEIIDLVYQLAHKREKSGYLCLSYATLKSYIFEAHI